MISGNLANEAIGRRIAKALNAGELKRDSRWLDVGCGAGAHASLATNWFPNYGLSQYTGIDIDQDAINYCKLRFAMFPELKFERTSFEDFRDEDGFRLIVDCFAMAYCADRDMAVGHAHDLLLSGGIYLGIWPGNNAFDAPPLLTGYIEETFAEFKECESTPLMEANKAWWLIQCRK